MNFALSSLDVGIILASLCAVVVVGWWAGRNQEKSVRGYFLASGRLPWYILGAAFVSTSVSSEQIVGTVGATYKDGMAIAQAVTMSGIVLVSLLTASPEESQWRPFQGTLAALTRYDEGVKRPWYQRPLLWWSLYVVGWVYLYQRFWRIRAEDAAFWIPPRLHKERRACASLWFCSSGCCSFHVPGLRQRAAPGQSQS